MPILEYDDQTKLYSVYRAIEVEWSSLKYSGGSRLIPTVGSTPDSNGTRYYSDLFETTSFMEALTKFKQMWAETEVSTVNNLVHC